MARGGCRRTRRYYAILDWLGLLVQLATQIFQRWTGVTAEDAVFQRAVAAALGE